MKTGTTVDDVARLEKILKRAIILKDIAGKGIYNTNKYAGYRNRNIEVIVHNGHAWSKKLHFPQSRQIHIYENDVWEAIQMATQDEPTAVWLLGSQN